MIFIHLLSFSHFSYAGIKDDVTQVMKLREEVELVAAEVESLKKASQAEVDVYLNREQEVNSNLLKEKFKTDQLKIQIKSGKDKIEKMSKNNQGTTLENNLTKFWTKYDSLLDKANPVIATKLKERLNKLKFDYKNKKISYEHALIQTWYLLEDDFKSSKEADFSISSLNYQGKNYQLEMVRLGRNLAFYRSAEGEYGQLNATPSLKLVKFSDSKSKEMIDLLIIQFKQQTKTGLYSLPGIRI